MSEARDEEPIVYCNWDGTWMAGRYVGAVLFEGRQLRIEPRLGLTTLRNWLSEAASVVLTETPGQLQNDESFVVQLLASVWAQRVAEASRHGLPALRREVTNRGSGVRGRLDVQASIRLLALGRGEAVSVRGERSLDHAASAAIVAAHAALRRWLPDERWLPPRVKELLPHLQAVTGSRPRVPTKLELDRIRYTPITAGFASVAELSRQIAGSRGLSADVDATGSAKGVLLDVAELWEMYVLSVLRKAAAPLTVTHGTRERLASKRLLRSDISGTELGTLIPDAILSERGIIRGIVDAKYKRIHPSQNTLGPQREDLYQMAAYVGRYAPAPGSVTGIFAYPDDPAQTEPPFAESHSPWSLSDGNKIRFLTLPHEAEKAVAKLGAAVNG